MSLGKRLKDARNVTGFTQRELADSIGVKHNTVSNWEKDKSTPDPATIEMLCQRLNITPNYLLIGVEDSSSLPAMSSDEIAFLQRYRVLTNSGKGAVNALLDYFCAELSRDIPAREVVQAAAVQGFAPRVISGRISTQGAAAGSGLYLDSDSFDDIEILENDLTRRADFYVPVQGDSMEPEYHDGDILIVENTSVSIGDVGVFTLDGGGYVKIRGKKELLSINPSYAPIPMTESIFCNGKVIGVVGDGWIVEA